MNLTLCHIDIILFTDIKARMSLFNPSHTKLDRLKIEFFELLVRSKASALEACAVNPMRIDFRSDGKASLGIN